jgi:hypothetical protein
MRNYLHAFLVYLSLSILSSGFAFGQQSVRDFTSLSSQGAQVESPKDLVPQNSKGFYWFEGFDSGALPDGWQNVVNEGNGFEFELSPYSHTVIYYFGDIQRDARLVTPLIDLSGLGTVTLGITHRIYAYESGWSNKILISNDGNNWETVAEFTEGFEPDDNRYMEFDITPAKGSDQVYLAFAVDYPFLTEYYEVVWEIVDVTVFEPVNTYNVSFVVEDEGGTALNDAVVSLNGTANAAGEYLFADLDAGTYSYTVELDGYTTAEGQVTVVDQDVQEIVVLSQPVIITEFPWFEGFDGGALPDGWQNVVNEGNGFEFFLAPYSHTVIYYFGDLQRDARLVTPLLDLSGLGTVTLGITHRIYAYETGWSHKILISNDGNNWETVAEFTEGFEPDDNRYMEFDITPAKGSDQVYLAFAVDYPLLPAYYEVVWEIVDVTVFEPVNTYNVSFVVEDEGGTALNDAVVSLNGTANAAGEYLFADLEAGTYNYTVELGGYTTAEGQVTVIDQDVRVTVVLLTGQYVELPEGWSLISSYLVPNDPTFEQIFADQLEDGNINILIGETGIFWPGFNINTLGVWNNYHGYKIKMNESDIVGITGTMVENQTVDLPKGTSYLPVLSDVPVIAGELFVPLAGKMNFALDLLDGLIYWPQGQIYTLEHLFPGRAYLVGMAEAGSFDFYKNDSTVKSNSKSGSAYPVGFAQFVKTGTPHLISIAHQAMENILEAGDLIAAFDNQNQCVGAVAYAGKSSNLGLIVFGDDQTTDLKDGLNDGEEIIIRVIKSASHEIIDLDATWNTTMPNQRFFNENGLSAISEFKASALSVNDPETIAIDLYPNPAKESISFRMHNAENAVVEIYDNMGRMVVKSEISKTQNTCNVSQLSTGVYVVKIHTQQNDLLTTKLIIE